MKTLFTGGILMGYLFLVINAQVEIFKKDRQEKGLLKGAVQWTACSGVETNSSMLDIRIDRCQTGETVCHFDPGYLVSVEADFIPGHATKSIKLGVDAVLENGYRIAIMSAGVPNSSVQPGNVYVIKFSIVPNDVLSGETFQMEVDILDDTNQVLFCVQTVVHINPFLS